MTCSGCGGPVSKRNTSGYCHQNPECKRKAQTVADARWHATHPETAAARNKAWRDSNADRRTEYFRERRKDPEERERIRANTQVFKTRPENAERVREYNRCGRQRYMARADRLCLFPDGCTNLARVGSKFCAEHARAESNRHYHRTAGERRQQMAEAQAWICPWCSDYLPPALTRTHVDHIIPRASGLVIEDAWNLQLLHGRCNQEKSDKITVRAIILAAEHGLTLAA